MDEACTGCLDVGVENCIACIERRQAEGRSGGKMEEVRGDKCGGLAGIEEADVDPICAFSRRGYICGSARVGGKRCSEPFGTCEHQRRMPTKTPHSSLLTPNSAKPQAAKEVANG